MGHFLSELVGFLVPLATQPAPCVVTRRHRLAGTQTLDLGLSVADVQQMDVERRAWASPGGDLRPRVPVQRAGQACPPSHSDPGPLLSPSQG